MAYIEREALLGALRPPEPGDERAAVLISDAKEIFRKVIMETPAADVAPVVRCKDCKYSWYDSSFNRLWCNRDSGTFSVQGDEFCSRGKRED